MTKEELEKEAEEIYQKTDREFMDCQDEGEIFTLAYLAGAEPREKQIQIDAEQIRALQKQNGELNDKVRDLEALIEKIKSDVIKSFGNEYNVLVAKLLKEWEIKENDTRYN